MTTAPDLFDQWAAAATPAAQPAETPEAATPVPPEAPTATPAALRRAVQELLKMGLLEQAAKPQLFRQLLTEQARVNALATAAGLDPVRGPGVVVTLTDAPRDANGLFPRDAAPDDLVVHQQDIDAVLNALWSAGAEAVQMQDQRIIATSAPRCVGNTLLLNGRTYSPPYTIAAIGDSATMQDALAAAPLVRLYRQYVIRFGLGYTEEARPQVQVVGSSGPLRLRYAQPSGPLGY